MKKLLCHAVALRVGGLLLSVCSTLICIAADPMAQSYEGFRIIPGSPTNPRSTFTEEGIGLLRIADKCNNLIENQSAWPIEITIKRAFKGLSDDGIIDAIEENTFVIAPKETRPIGYNIIAVILGTYGKYWGKIFSGKRELDAKRFAGSFCLHKHTIASSGAITTEKLKKLPIPPLDACAPFTRLPTECMIALGAQPTVKEARYILGLPENYTGSDVEKAAWLLDQFYKAYETDRELHERQRDIANTIREYVKKSRRTLLEYDSESK